MFTLKVDLGQVIISGVIVVIGYLVNKTVSDIFKRLDDHDDMIRDLIGKVEFLLGLTNSKHHNRLDN